jgi:hypothetical protein
MVFVLSEALLAIVALVLTVMSYSMLPVLLMIFTFFTGCMRFFNWS